MPVDDPADAADSTFSNALFMKAADVNQDGKPDIIMHRIGTEWHDPNSTYSYDLQILTGNGDGSFSNQIIDIDQAAECRNVPKFRGGTRTQCYFVDLDHPYVVDYDQDGDVDVVFQREVVSVTDGQLFVFVNNNGIFDPKPAILPATYETVVISQYQSYQRLVYPDWYKAAVAGEPIDPQIALLRSNYLVDTTAGGVEVDYYNDGYNDFIVVDNGELKIFNKTAAGFDFTYAGMPVSTGGLLTAGDFDGNGSIDLILIDAVPDYIGNSTITPLYNMDPALNGT